VKIHVLASIHTTFEALVIPVFGSCLFRVMVTSTWKKKKIKPQAQTCNLEFHIEILSERLFENKLNKIGVFILYFVSLHERKVLPWQYQVTSYWEKVSSRGQCISKVYLPPHWRRSSYHPQKVWCHGSKPLHQVLICLHPSRGRLLHHPL
jgi:hypothetical protein